MRIRTLQKRVFQGLRINIDNKKVKRSKFALIQSYFSRRLQRLILRRWTLGTVRANEGEITDCIKKRYFKQWLHNYQVKALTGINIAEMQHNKTILQRSFRKLLAHVEQCQLVKVADQFRKQQLLDRWTLYVHYRRRRMLQIEKRI